MKLIEIKGLSKSFDGMPVLENVDLSVDEHEVVALIGGSGCGKSTLFRCMELLETPDAGSIWIDGQEITARGAKVDRIRRSMGMVYQNFNLFSHMSVMDNMCLAPVRLKGMKRAEAEKKAESLLDQVGLHGRGGAMPAMLSGGQKQRVAIARCLMMEPKIMLFDEPTSALDPGMTGEVMATMRMLRKQGMTMLIITHEMNFAREIATRVLFMADRGIYEDGTAEQVFEHPERPKTIAFINKLKRFEYQIRERYFDLMQLQGGIQAFAERYALKIQTSYRLQLCAEELLGEMMQEIRGDNVEIDVAVEHSANTGKTRLLIETPAPLSDPFGDGPGEEKLGMMIVKRTVSSYSHRHENGKSRIALEI